MRSQDGPLLSLVGDKINPHDGKELTSSRVGGVVSETSFKFFIQFVVYTAIFCVFALIVCAYFTAELVRETGSANVHWALGIGLYVSIAPTTSLSI